MTANDKALPIVPPKMRIGSETAELNQTAKRMLLQTDMEMLGAVSPNTLQTVPLVDALALSLLVSSSGTLVDHCSSTCVLDCASFRDVPSCDAFRVISWNDKLGMDAVLLALSY